MTICVSDTAMNLIDNSDALPAQILRAVREIGLPRLTLHSQPGDTTLVNADTIFYTEPRPFDRTITLLGYDIDVEARPVGYHWIHDDGTTTTTRRPGRPYPATDIVHRYRAPATDLHPRVDVTYHVRYRIDSGPWQDLTETLTAAGPTIDLTVNEAAPVLTTP